MIHEYITTCFDFLREKDERFGMTMPYVAHEKIRRTKICESAMGFRTSRCLRQPDYLSGHIDRCETHSFASLLRNRFAFIGAIVKLERTRSQQPTGLLSRYSGGFVKLKFL